MCPLKVGTNGIFYDCQFLTLSFNLLASALLRYLNPCLPGYLHGNSNLDYDS